MMHIQPLLSKIIIATLLLSLPSVLLAGYAGTSGIFPLAQSWGQTGITVTPKAITSALSPTAASQLVSRLEAEQKEYLEKILLPKYTDRISEKFLQELHGREIDDYNRFTDPEIKQLLNETREHGCKVSTGEGMYFPILDYEQLKPYRPYVTPDMRDYINIMALESTEKAWEDGGLIISYEKTLNRALTQEEFLLKYKGVNSSVVANIGEVGNIFAGYVYTLFSGNRHTSHFNFQTKIIRPESRQFFDALSASPQKNTNSRLLQALLELNTLLKKNNYQQTDEVKHFQQSTARDIVNSLTK